MTSDLNTITVPNTSATNDRCKSLRAHAWASFAMGGLCAAFAIRVFFIMLAPTHSFGAALSLWKHDKGVLASLTGVSILTLGGLLTFARLSRAEAWAQLSQTDRALSVIGIIPASLLYYPIMILATVLALILYFCMLTWVGFVRRIERLTHWERRDRTL